MNLEPIHDLRQKARRLANAMLVGPFEADELENRAKKAVHGDQKWIARLIHRTVARFGRVRPRERDLIRFLCGELESATDAEEDEEFQIESNYEPTQFAATCGLQQTCDVLPWDTVGELADWLGLAQNELNWFADLRQWQRLSSDGPLRHYQYHWIKKRHGQCRLIEIPKSRLREMQRRLLRSIFEHMPLHEAAHGFRKGRSTGTHVAPHVGKAVVLRMDLQNFFPSVAPYRLVRILMNAGYAESVARVLTGLCTNTVPQDVWQRWPFPEDSRQKETTERLYQRPHFPQGAPTSPAIANVCAYRLDCRLQGLAEWANARYTRYADDLLFSGEESFRRRLDRFKIYVGAIALAEGFEINHRKTRIMPRSVQQRAVGLVLNEKINTPRREFDRLKAILHLCLVCGPMSQNRDGHSDFRGHLRGRIGYVRQWNPAKSEKLLRLFNMLHWG